MKARGFTLIEILLVSVVAAVLLCVAYAGYAPYAHRARVAHAVGEIGEIYMKAETFDLNNRRYPTSLVEIGMDGKLDPWGNPYQFLSFDGIEGNGPKRKFRSAVPVNSSFDVYSMGPDGSTATPFTAAPGQDDIVMAGDGTYFGKAGDYGQ